MPFCCIPGCSYRTYPYPLAFFTFPENPSRYQQWLNVLAERRIHVTPGPETTICSLHFRAEDFFYDCYSKVLRAYTVPSQFNNLFQYISEEHNYSLPCAKELKRRLEAAKGISAQLSKKLRKVRKDNRRQAVKAYSKKMRATQREMTPPPKPVSPMEVLEKTRERVPVDLLQSLIENKRLGRELYTKEFKSFASSLQYYSPKDYELVKESFDLGLPEAIVAREWFTSDGSGAGFSKVAFRVLQRYVTVQKQKGKQVVVSLMFNEMELDRDVEWTGDTFIGPVDVGQGPEPEDYVSTPATDALTFMVVSHGQPWKILLGYFFYASFDDKIKLIQMCLKKLDDVGVTAANFTCDDPLYSTGTLTRLGADLSPGNLRGSFNHSGDPNQTVASLFDVSRMKSLLQETLKDLKEIVDRDDKQIKWRFVSQVQQRLRDNDPSLESFLKSGGYDDICFLKSGSQDDTWILTETTADAIDYCATVLKLKEFLGSESTANFVRKINSVFDIMEAKDRFKDKKSTWLATFHDCRDYLENLRLSDGTRWTNSIRKYAVVGLLINIQSLESLLGQMDDLIPDQTSPRHFDVFLAGMKSHFLGRETPSAKLFRKAFENLKVVNESGESGPDFFLENENSYFQLKAEPEYEPPVDRTKLDFCPDFFWM